MPFMPCTKPTPRMVPPNGKETKQDQAGNVRIQYMEHSGFGIGHQLRSCSLDSTEIDSERTLMIPRSQAKLQGILHMGVHTYMQIYDTLHTWRGLLRSAEARCRTCATRHCFDGRIEVTNAVVPDDVKFAVLWPLSCRKKRKSDTDCKRCYNASPQERDGSWL